MVVHYSGKVRTSFYPFYINLGFLERKDILFFILFRDHEPPMALQELSVCLHELVIVR